MQVQLPRYIALCGNPKAGKSEVQKILHRRFGVMPVDDGHVLREFAVHKLGLDWSDVLSQEGKLRETVILGKTWQHRKLLGDFGKALEDFFGEDIMPFIATRGLDPDGSYSFGSVRKAQGAFYKGQGGVVIEVVNPLAGPSGNDFDVYDASLVDYTIVNDALLHMNPEAALADLEMKVIDAVNALTGISA